MSMRFLSPRFLLPATLVLGTALGALTQQRVKAKGPPDFDSVYAAVGEHWKGARWGQCFVSARDLMGVISKRRAQAIREAMPNPTGYTREPVEENDPQATALMAAMSASVGTVIEQRYQGQGGKSLRITVTADSPMLGMFRMILQNPAMLQQNQELVKYEQCSAVLETQGSSVTLRFMIGDSLIEAQFDGADADHALEVLDQSAVTKLNAALVG